MNLPFLYLDRALDGVTNEYNSDNCTVHHQLFGFTAETQCVYCAVRAESLRVIQVSVHLEKFNYVIITGMNRNCRVSVTDLKLSSTLICVSNSNTSFGHLNTVIKTSFDRYPLCAIPSFQFDAVCTVHHLTISI